MSLATAPASSALTLTGNRLPRWAPWASVAGSALVAWGVLVLAGEPTPTTVVALTALLHVVALTSASRYVEGPRRAKDRLATTLVTVAFLLALVPLVS